MQNTNVTCICCSKFGLIQNYYHCYEPFEDEFSGTIINKNVHNYISSKGIDNELIKLCATCHAYYVALIDGPTKDIHILFQAVLKSLDDGVCDLIKELVEHCVENDETEIHREKAINDMENMLRMVFRWKINLHDEYDAYTHRKNQLVNSNCDALLDNTIKIYKQFESAPTDTLTDKTIIDKTIISELPKMFNMFVEENIKHLQKLIV